MNLPVESIVEQAVNRQVNKLVGDKDTNLNTIVKMSLIPSANEGEYESILANMKNNNNMEQYFIEQEYQLTYDCAGNICEIPRISVDKDLSKDIIPVKCINNGETTESQEKSTTDPRSILSEPK